MDRLLFKKGFTLAEMLVVLLIVSVVATASVPMLHKRFRVDKDDAVHGKYECYRTSAGSVHETQYDNNVKTFERDAAACSFTPTKKATFFIIQAVGAGGGGASAQDPSLRSDSSSSGSFTIPKNGTISVPSTPVGLSAAFNNAGYTCSAWADGGGGHGGSGNGSYSSPTAACETSLGSGVYSYVLNNPVGCSWSYTAYKGGNGGQGDSCSVGSTAVSDGSSISVYGGSAGSDGYAYINGSSCDAYAGGDGENASSSGNGANATTSYSGGGSGGSGNSGFFGYTHGVTSTPSWTPYPGYSGSAGSSSFSCSPSTTVSYGYNDVSKTLYYGGAGTPGSYISTFYTKLPAGLIIYPGIGGGSNTNGQDTTVGTAAGAFLRALGGYGNTSIYGSSYSMYNLGSGTNSISVSGESGLTSSFSTILQFATPEGTSGVSTASGAAGSGGGSSTCSGFNFVASLGGSNYANEIWGSPTCQDTTADANSNSYDSGSSGGHGAVIIIW